MVESWRHRVLGSALNEDLLKARKTCKIYSSSSSSLLSGSSHFDAKVCFKDNETKNILGTIDVDKQSWALGGALAGTQDVKSHMESAAEKIVSEITKAKQANTTLVSTNK